MKKILFPAIIILAILIYISYTFNDKIVKTYSNLTDEQIEELENSDEIFKVIINDDGSVDVTMSRKYLEDNQKYYYDKLEEYINDEYLNNENYSYINEIKMNDDLTSFDIYTNLNNMPYELLILIEDLLISGVNCYEAFSLEKEMPEIYVTIFNRNNEVINKYNWSNFYKDIHPFIKENYMSYLQLLINQEIEYSGLISDVKINDDMTSFEVYFNSTEDSFYEIILAQELISTSIEYYEVLVEMLDEISEVPEIYVKIFNSNNEIINEYNSSNIENLMEEVLSEYFSE